MLTHPQSSGMSQLIWSPPGRQFLLTSVPGSGPTEVMMLVMGFSTGGIVGVFGVSSTGGVSGSGVSVTGVFGVSSAGGVSGSGVSVTGVFGVSSTGGVSGSGVSVTGVFEVSLTGGVLGVFGVSVTSFFWHIPS